MKTKTTSQKHSQTIRQDLKPHKPIRRRQTNPTASSISTMPDTNDQQDYPFIDTYSAFLRDIGPIPVLFNQDYRHRPSFAISPIQDIQNTNQSALSDRHSGFYPVDQHQDFVVRNTWQKDLFGWDQWPGNGRIEEVDDDAVDHTMDDLAHDSNDEQEVKSSTAKGKSTFLSFVDGLQEVPSPSPSRPRKTPSSRSTPNRSEYHTLRADSTLMTRPNKAHTSTSVLDSETEVSLVGEILDVLTASQEDVKYMNTVRTLISLSKFNNSQVRFQFFLAKSHEDELSQQIDLCSRMEESLAALYRAMDLRTRIGAEEWNVRSSTWYQKYSKRLISLRL